MALKTTYKAPGITGTSTFKPFYIYMCIGINTICLKITSMIQISSKVFSISECKKQRSLLYTMFNNT